MLLFTKAQKAQLVANGASQDPFNKPIVKWFTADANCTWLISEIDPNDNDMAFGLCDLGFGCPEMGSVYVPEVEALRGKFGLPVERDLHFTADKTLVEYANQARNEQRIGA